jgi:TolB-like protein/DNA-binding winged helix-turn-helix (wHTH) protein/Tfp pilus assembly protein PilF
VHEPDVASPVIRFGVFEADGRSRELRKQGVRVRLQEQPFHVLWLLLDRAGEVVTRDELRQRIWPSSVYVDFDHGMNNAVARVREALGDTAGSPRFIETLPRLGYRFVCPVTRDAPSTLMSALAVPPAEPPAAPAPAPAPAPAAGVSKWLDRRVLARSAAAMVLLVALAVTPWLVTRNANEPVAHPLPLEPSIAVLPFSNLGDGEEAEIFADGLTEELINRLAEIDGLWVVGRTSSFKFKDHHLPAQEIAAALGVNYLLEGSVRQGDGRLRATAQLIEARNGFHLWSQNFDLEAGEIFAMQDEIAKAVATVLKGKLVDNDVRRIQDHGTRDPEAHRLYLMGLAQLRGYGRRDIPQAQQFFEKALARDPGYADAQAGIAHYYFRDVWISRLNIEESVRLGSAAAIRAVELAPDSCEALLAMANVEIFKWRFHGDSAAYTRALAGFQRAIEIAPSSAPAHFNLARAFEWDEPDLALRMFERAAELDPLFSNAQGRAVGRLSERGLYDAERQRLQELDRQPLMSGKATFAMYRGMLEVRLGRFDEALRLLPDLPELEFELLRWSMYLSLGDMGEARASLPAGDDALSKVLREAAEHSMAGNPVAAFAVLDRHRGEYPLSRTLHATTARMALAAGHPELALPLLEQIGTDLARGFGPVTARNVMPAMDLAASYAATGKEDQARALLKRVSTYLDGPQIPWHPMFTFLRARAHALAGERDQAFEALDLAYARGFRKTWSVDLNPSPYFYVDSVDTDPAFREMKADARFTRWRERIQSDNSRQLVALRAANGEPREKS